MCRKLGIILWKNCFSGVLKMTSNDTQPRRPLFQEIKLTVIKKDLNFYFLLKPAENKFWVYTYMLEKNFVSY